MIAASIVAMVAIMAIAFAMTIITVMSVALHLLTIIATPTIINDRDTYWAGGVESHTTPLSPSGEYCASHRAKAMENQHKEPLQGS